MPLTKADVEARLRGILETKLIRVATWGQLTQALQSAAQTDQDELLAAVQAGDVLRVGRAVHLILGKAARTAASNRVSTMLSDDLVSLADLIEILED